MNKEQILILNVLYLKQDCINCQSLVIFIHVVNNIFFSQISNSSSINVRVACVYSEVDCRAVRREQESGVKTVRTVFVGNFTAFYNSPTAAAPVSGLPLSIYPVYACLVYLSIYHLTIYLSSQLYINGTCLSP